MFPGEEVIDDSSDYYKYEQVPVDEEFIPAGEYDD